MHTSTTSVQVSGSFIHPPLNPYKKVLAKLREQIIAVNSAADKSKKPV